MDHRHLNLPAEWGAGLPGPAEIDSVLDRGVLADWRTLFQEAARRPEIAARVRRVAEGRPRDGYSAVALGLLDELERRAGCDGR